VNRTGRLISRIVISLATLVIAQSATADLLPAQLFTKKPEVFSMKLSPDGKIVAALAPGEAKNNIVFIRVEDSKVVGRVRLSRDNDVANFWWTNNHRIIASLALSYGALDQPRLTGELVGVDSDGSHFKYLYGFRGERQELGTRLKIDKADNGFAWMVDPLPDDDEHALIAIRSSSTQFDTLAAVYKIDVNSGGRSRVIDAPTRGGVDFIVDHHGEVRFAFSQVDGFHARGYQRKPGTTEWQAYASSDGTIEPVGLSTDDKTLFAIAPNEGSHGCLVMEPAAGGDRQKLACDDNSGVSAVIESFGRNAEPIAVEFAAGKPEVRMLKTMNPDAEVLQKLLSAFAGKHVQVTSSTRDGHRLLVFVRDDRTPGDYYLFNTQTLKADYFLGLREGLDPDEMAESRPIHYQSRDGLTIWGYLTLPKGRTAKNLPLIVNPHGGPFGVRDVWDFDAETQLLANRGYAVLQVNFRGSGGYGDAFIEAGVKRWGTKMIDDITDATHWAIEQGYADPARICIYGASYGGFAALMSAVREPELYRCVVGYAGVYDLKALGADFRWYGLDLGRRYFSEAVAGDEKEMIAQSPTTYLDQLKAPMLIIHGEADTRAPYTQATALKAALESRHKPHEWLAKAGEGHGFWKDENVDALYVKLFDFLERNLGKGAPEQAAAATH